MRGVPEMVLHHPSSEAGCGVVENARGPSGTLMTSEAVDRIGDAPVARHRMSDRNFRLWLVFPAVLLLLLIGVFPLVYSLVISFQNLTMTDQDTSFHGLMNYAQLFRDHRLWKAILHTLLITAVALP